MSASFNALVSRGVDSKLAQQLADSGITISKLKAMSSDKIEDLGISNLIAEQILDKQRPPIPTETVIKLLYESKWTCCICRDKAKSVIIHHIVEWSESRDHAEGNLVVLCHEHHDLAHSDKKLSLNLTKDRIKAIQQKWIDEVKLTDTNTTIGLASVNQSRWDYFNHGRIFELYLKNNISNKQFKTTPTMIDYDYINSLGTFKIKDDKKRNQLYNFDNGYLLYYYMQELFDETLKTIPLIDLTDKFTKLDIKSLLSPGTYIAQQAAFYFKDQTKLGGGKGQRRICYYHKNHIRIEFEYDAFETTSTSAWAVHLRGHKVATVIGLVKSIVEQDDLLTITISCLAMGCYLDDHQHRKTAPNLYLSLGDEIETED